MSTFVQDITLSIEHHWREVELLVSLAKDNEANEALYNALCRSATVLMIAHFEGFIKSCVKAVIDDINKFSKFSDLPTQLKQTFCNKLVQSPEEKKDNKHLYQRISKLIEILDMSGVQLSETDFLILNEYGNFQNNPKPDLIDKICNNFGIIGFFERISNSDFDIVFTDERTELENLTQRLREHLIEGSKAYPYTIDTSSFNIKPNPRSSKGESRRTLWQAFLDELHRKRHAIAHGSDMSNQSSTEEIILGKDKLIVLQYAFMLIICESSLPVSNN
jgi:hypothetical protein